MGKYDLLIENLKEQKPARLDNDEYYFSFYIPFKYPNIEKDKIQLKSDTLNALRNHPNLKKEKGFHDVLIETLENYLKRIPIKGSGVAIFFKVKISEVLSGKNWEIPTEDVSIVPLYVKPQNSVHIGKVYCLDQILWANEVDKEVLVININEKEASIYIFNDRDLDEIESVNKRIWVVEKPKHFETANFTSSDYTSYGASSDKHERFEDSMLNLFVERANEEIESISKLKEHDIGRVLLFYSNPFTSSVNTIEEGIKKNFNLDTLSSQKNITNEEDLKVEVKESITKLVIEDVKSLHKEAKSNRELFVTDWKGVIDASRMKKIEILFIQHDINKKGYILGNDLIYTYPYKNTQLINDIYPWIIRDVISAGGRIVLLEREEYDYMPKVSAALRF